VHIRTRIPPDTVVPIGWVALGDPVRLHSPKDHEEISKLLAELDFAGTVFGDEPAPRGETRMPERSRRYARALGAHKDDRIVELFRPAPARWGRRALAAVLTTRAVRRAAFALMRQLGGARWVRRLARRRGSLWLAYAAALPDATRPPGLPSSVLEPEGQPRGTAVLLTGCVAETAFGRTNVATARLLQRAGVRVLVPRGQGCCGALALHPGAVERARLPARGCAVVPGPSGA